MLNRKTVITAAQCLYNHRTLVNATDLTVKLWSSRRGFKVYNYLIHDSFTFSLNNDIALVYVASSELPEFLIPICIENSDILNTKSLANDIGTAISTFRGETSFNGLHEIPMPMVNLSECVSSDRNFYSKYINKNNFCAGFKNGKQLFSKKYQ